ncbi:glycosyltransferase [Microbacterium trichothecenolyticum]|uniref:UDP-N-acetylglucosamine--N-acetylmuramyl-(Pentapeptide) pyrophosphoryl-undecaprenol N-acetylglucosamine transferase n=1 Tax=Microbacterium trichothecenolyticum TaxID=69370 RepID=A0ABU0TU99_MICTR|nr:glycosyltransferase [Microbacterium trichothecenolyticum]MDQ1123234.1 UDP-N-acetylglucosamine--N-acetylmuramyl-(pentapeptide) pyrophosphoryl-undecaprenol N-acetylglucosamine transferase [Microbacterium trichothecenolyticum]
MIDDIFGGRKALLLASTGGHLAQLHRLTQMSPVSEDSVWVTFDSPQSRSLLEGARTLFIDYIPPRGWRQILSATGAIRHTLKSEPFETIVSTGAGIALATHVTSALRGRAPVYIESVSRVTGPSTTGLILERVPGVRRFSQHRWGHQRRGWTTAFSVLDTFTPSATSRVDAPRSFFVTLGTIKPYEFAELVKVVEKSLPDDAEIVWQLGATTYQPTRGTVFTQMSGSEFDAAVRKADVVITHAGVGTLIALVESGADVIAVPRRKFRHEHVDDHQLQIAEEFASRGLIRVREADELSTLLRSF